MPVSNGTVTFSCGCSQQAGIASTDAQGHFTLQVVSTATPPTPNPTYTLVPGRNYVIIAKAAGGAETWTMAFLGKTPSHNKGLGSNGSVSTDIYTSAATLYVFYTSPLTAKSDQAFDQWNFTTVSQWAAHLRSSAQTTAEQQLLNDITNAQKSNTTLFPTKSSWYPASVPQVNPTIKNDLAAIKSAGTAADPALPTPCPGGLGSCTGTPTP